jgi:hypothetical protein
MRNSLSVTFFGLLLVLMTNAAVAEESSIQEFLQPEAQQKSDNILKNYFRLASKYCNRTAQNWYDNLKDVVVSQSPSAFENDTKIIDQQILPMMGLDPQKRLTMNKCEEKEKQLEEKLGLHEPITEESLRKRRAQIALIENPKAKMQEYFRYFSHLIAYRAFPCSANPLVNLQKYLKSVQLNMKLSDDAAPIADSTVNPFVIPNSNPALKSMAADSSTKSIQTQQRLAGTTQSIRLTLVADTSPVVAGTSVQVSQQQGLYKEAGANATAVSAVKSFDKGAGNISIGTSRVRNLQIENSKPVTSSYVNIGYIF